MDKVILSNGVEMPQMGYGVYQVNPEECECCVADAISVGYRMIDTAQAYHNEEAVGRAWTKSGISRDELFLVSKVLISNYGDGQTMKSLFFDHLSGNAAKQFMEWRGLVKPAE